MGLQLRLHLPQKQTPKLTRASSPDYRQSDTHMLTFFANRVTAITLNDLNTYAVILAEKDSGGRWFSLQKTIKLAPQDLDWARIRIACPHTPGQVTMAA